MLGSLLRRALTSLLVALVAFWGLPAAADTVLADGDGAVPLAANPVDFGTVCLGETVAKPVYVNLQRSGPVSGGEVFAKSIRAVRTGGRVVTCGATAGFHPQIDLRHIFFRNVEVLGSTMGSKADLIAVLGHVQAGRIAPVIHEILPLARAADAHRLLEERRAFGKVVLVP